MRFFFNLGRPKEPTVCSAPMCYLLLPEEGMPQKHHLFIASELKCET